MYNRILTYKKRFYPVSTVYILGLILNNLRGVNKFIQSFLI